MECENLRVSDCGEPQTVSITNGMLTFTSSMFAPGATLTYECAENHQATTSLVTECIDESFTWSLDSNPPVCRRCKCRWNFYLSNIFNLCVNILHLLKTLLFFIEGSLYVWLCVPSFASMYATISNFIEILYLFGFINFFNAHFEKNIAFKFFLYSMIVNLKL